MVLPLTSSLNDVRNDTGRTAFCGPYVVAAITGYSISKIEARIHEHRGAREAARKVIEGTTTDDVAAALGAYDYAMHPIQRFTGTEKKLRPSVWQWLQRPRPRAGTAFYLLAIDTRREGHWIVIKGTKLCDTFTGGQWVDVAYGPHKGCKVAEVFEVRRRLGI